MSTGPRILTNMTFWQSDTWLARTASIYDLSARRDPDTLPWWREAWALFRRRPYFDLVVTMGVRESMAYALLCALTFRPPRQIMCEVFIDNPQPMNPLWLIKNAIYGALARRAIGILANCSPEVDFISRRYGVPRDRVRYVPLNTTIPKPRMADGDDGFVLSAGRTLRDYGTMLQAARLIAAPVTIICGRNDLRNADLPPRVTIRRELSRDEYLATLRRARVVALPLKPTERATGQVVMLEAMAMGKPVVTTDSPGTVDIIRDGINGFLVPVGNPGALADRIRDIWADDALRRRVGEAAVADMREMASANRHARLKLDAILELWTSRRR